MTRHRAILLTVLTLGALLAAPASIGFVADVYAMAWSSRLYDVSIFTTVASAPGERMYDYANDDGLGFVYPPFARLVIAPLGWVSSAVGGVVFTTLIVALYAWVSWEIGRFAVSRSESDARPVRLGIMAAVAVLSFEALVLSFPGHENLGVGNVSGFVILLPILDAMGRFSPRLTGVVTGICAAIKLVPLAFLAYYAVTGQWRAFWRLAATFGLAAGIGWVLWPGPSRWYWTESLFTSSKMGGYSDYSLSHILLGVLNVPPPTVLLGAVSLVFLGLGCLAVRRLYDRGEVFLAACGVGALCGYLAPVSGVHRGIAMVVGGLLLLFHPQARVWLRVLGAAILAINLYVRSDVLVDLIGGPHVPLASVAFFSCLVAVSLVGLLWRTPHRAPLPD